MQFDSAESDGPKSDWRIRWPNSSAFGWLGPSDSRVQHWTLLFHVYTNIREDQQKSNLNLDPIIFVPAYVQEHENGIYVLQLRNTYCINKYSVWILYSYHILRIVLHKNVTNGWVPPRITHKTDDTNNLSSTAARTAVSLRNEETRTGLFFSCSVCVTDETWRQNAWHTLHSWGKTRIDTHSPGYCYKGIPVPRVLCHNLTELTEVPGTGMQVLQNLQKFRVPVWKSCRTQRSSGYGMQVLQNSQKF